MVPADAPRAFNAGICTLAYWNSSDAVSPTNAMARSYDWAGPRVLRGLVPPVHQESPEPPATLFLSHIFGDQPMSSSTLAASIIYLGLDVHKDSVTIAVLPADVSAPTRIDVLA